MKKKSVQSKNPPLIAGQACKSVIQTTYDIVKAHGGNLEIESGSGGSVFKIYLSL